MDILRVVIHIRDVGYDSDITSAAFDLPVEIVDDLQINNLHLFLTRFGFLIRESDGKVFGPFPAASGERWVGDSDLGIAVVTGAQLLHVAF